jgi:hypothetical protein
VSEGLRKRRRPYLNVPSSAVNDRRLSYKARGIHHYLLDKPAGWDVRSLAIAGDSDLDGKDAVQAGLRELARLGYYRIEHRRLLNGRLLTGTAVSEFPDPVWAAQYAEYEGPVPCVQQPGGAFRVQCRDGTLVSDGFDDDEGPFDPNDGVCAGQTGTGFSGSGTAGSGTSGSGQTGAGPAGTGKSRPFVITEESPSKTKPSASQKGERATRIPGDFRISPDMRAFAAARCPDVDATLETEIFMNYWLARAGATALKLDWVLTWKNWMLKAEQQAPQRDRRPRGNSRTNYSGEDHDDEWPTARPA